MNIYLAVITTVLVITQVIRVLQNRVQLKRQQILFEKQLGQLEDVTQADLDLQREAYRAMIKYFDYNEEALWNGRYEDLYGSRTPQEGDANVHF